jgi:aquaporin Z
MPSNLSARLAAEFIGTFALIFVGAGAAALGVGGVVGVAFAHGLVVATFVYGYGPISGCHINPAVTIGLWTAGEIDARDALLYIIVQLLGGLVGALMLRFVLGTSEIGLGNTVPTTNLPIGDQTINVSVFAALIVEIILTFFLVNAVLNTAVAERAGHHAALAIGLTLTFCILMGGPLTGASLNPARTLGPALVSLDPAALWVYLIGPPVGGILAALLYKGVLEKAS